MSAVMRPRLERVSVLGNPREHRVEPRAHRVVHPGVAEAARELLVEPAGRGVRLGQRLEVHVRRAELLRERREGVGDVATGVGRRDALLREPARDGAEVAEVRRDRRRGRRGRLVRRLVLDHEAAAEPVVEAVAGCTGVALPRVATAGSGMLRATSVAGATSSTRRCTCSPATALTTAWPARKARPSSTSAALPGSRQTTTTSAASTTAWLSGATRAEGNRAARLAERSALRGDSTIAGGSVTPSHRPVTIAAAMEP